MKDLETLQKLEKNPFYTLSEEEKSALKALRSRKATRPAPQKGADVASTSTDEEGVAVKANGKLDKHPTDPKQES